MLTRIIVGLVIVVIGFSMVWKTLFYLRIFGRIRFAERYLSTEGGSRIFIKLLGTAAIFLGVFIATNLIQGTIVNLIGPLFSSL